MLKRTVELTLTCSCGTSLPEGADAVDSIDGIVRCGCGARYAYSATMLVPPNGDQPVEELIDSEPLTDEQSAGQQDDR